MSQNNEGTQDINKNVDEIGEKLKILVEYKKAYDRGEEVTEEQLAYIINDITDKFLEMESILGVNLYNKLLSKSNGCSDYVELLCMLRSGIQLEEFAALLYDAQQSATTLYDAVQRATTLYDAVQRATKLYYAQQSATKLYDAVQRATTLYYAQQSATKPCNVQCSETPLYNQQLTIPNHAQQRTTTPHIAVHRFSTQPQLRDMKFHTLWTMIVKTTTSMTCKVTTTIEINQLLDAVDKLIDNAVKRLTTMDPTASTMLRTAFICKNYTQKVATVDAAFERIIQRLYIMEEQNSPSQYIADALRRENAELHELVSRYREARNLTEVPQVPADHEIQALRRREREMDEYLRKMNADMVEFKLAQRPESEFVTIRRDLEASEAEVQILKNQLDTLSQSLEDARQCDDKLCKKVEEYCLKNRDLCIEVENLRDEIDMMRRRNRVGLNRDVNHDGLCDTQDPCNVQEPHSKKYCHGILYTMHRVSSPHMASSNMASSNMASPRKRPYSDDTVSKSEYNKLCNELDSALDDLSALRRELRAAKRQDDCNTVTSSDEASRLRRQVTVLEMRLASMQNSAGQQTAPQNYGPTIVGNLAPQYKSGQYNVSGKELDDAKRRIAELEVHSKELDNARLRIAELESRLQSTNTEELEIIKQKLRRAEVDRDAYADRAASFARAMSEEDRAAYAHRDLIETTRQSLLQCQAVVAGIGVDASDAVKEFEERTKEDSSVSPTERLRRMVAERSSVDPSIVQKRVDEAMSLANNEARGALRRLASQLTVAEALIQNYRNSYFAHATVANRKCRSAVNDESAKLAAAQREVMELRGEAVILRNTLNNCKKGIAPSIAPGDDPSMIMDKLVASNDSLNNQVSILRAEATTYKNEIERLRAAVPSIKAEKPDIKPDVTQSLLNELEVCRNNALRLTGDAERHRNDAERHRHEAERYKSDAERHRNDAARHGDEVERLMADVERYKSDAERHRNEAERYKNDAERHRNEAERYKSDAERHRGDAQIQGREVARLRDEVERLEMDKIQYNTALVPVDDVKRLRLNLDNALREKSSLERANMELVPMQQNVARLTEELEIERKRYFELNDEFIKATANFNKELDKAKRSTYGKITAAVEDAKKTLRNELATQTLEQIDEIKRQHDLAMSAANNRNAKAIEDVKSRNSEQIEEMKAAYNRQIAVITRDNSEMLANSDQAIANRDLYAEEARKSAEKLAILESGIKALMNAMGINTTLYTPSTNDMATALGDAVMRIDETRQDQTKAILPPPVRECGPLAEFLNYTGDNIYYHMNWFLTMLDSVLPETKTRFGSVTDEKEAQKSKLGNIMERVNTATNLGNAYSGLLNAISFNRTNMPATYEQAVALNNLIATEYSAIRTVLGDSVLEDLIDKNYPKLEGINTSTIFVIPRTFTFMINSTLDVLNTLSEGGVISREATNIQSMHLNGIFVENMALTILEVSNNMIIAPVFTAAMNNMPPIQSSTTQYGEFSAFVHRAKIVRGILNLISKNANVMAGLFHEIGEIMELVNGASEVRSVPRDETEVVTFITNDKFITPCINNLRATADNIRRVLNSFSIIGSRMNLNYDTVIRLINIAEMMVGVMRIDTSASRGQYDDTATRGSYNVLQSSQNRAAIMDSPVSGLSIRELDEDM